MVHKTTYATKFKRRSKGKTDYKKRLGLLKSGLPRLVVRILSRQAIVQVVGYAEKGDHILTGATSLELKKYGWNSHRGNVCAAYLTGLLAGKKAKKLGVKKAVLDIGLLTPVKGSNVFSALKGFVDAGIKVPHSKECLPSEERITGKVIAQYKKTDVDKEFEAVKKAIEKVGE